VLQQNTGRIPKVAVVVEQGVGMELRVRRLLLERSALELKTYNKQRLDLWHAAGDSGASVYRLRLSFRSLLRSWPQTRRPLRTARAAK